MVTGSSGNARTGTHATPAVARPAFGLSFRIGALGATLACAGAAAGAFAPWAWAGLGAGVALGALGALAGARLVAPAGALAAAAERIGAGDGAATVPALDRADALGAIARALEAAKAHVARVPQIERQLADLARRAPEERVDALRAMADAIEDATRRMLDQVAGHAGRLNRNAEQMTASAMLLDHNASTMTGAAEDNRASAERSSVAAAQLFASFQSMSGQVGQSAEAMGQVAGAGQDAKAAIADLADSVEAVGKVSAMIAEIAGSTKLLALNATIEAARAGEAGKGFAVVANEVKSLADQTARSTDEITRSLGEIKRRTDDAVRGVADMVAAIGRVEGWAGAIAGAVEQQTAATRQIADGAERTKADAAAATERVAVVGRESRGALARAEELSAIAQAMADNVASLGSGIARIVRTSTKDVDRRASKRVAVTVGCEIVAGGVTGRGIVRDLSTTGARVDDVSEGLPAKDGTIRFDGSGIALRFELIQRAEGTLRLRFEAEPADINKLDRELARFLPSDVLAA